MTLPYFQVGRSGQCVYCGDVATAKDHIFPVAFQTLNKRQQSYIGLLGPKAPVCRDCNSGLGDRMFDTFDKRCRFARDRLNRKAKPIDWTLEDIAKLGYTLQTLVRHSINVNLWLRCRADWYESKDYILNLEALQWESAALHHPFLSLYFAPTLQLVTEYYRDWHRRSVFT